MHHVDLNGKWVTSGWYGVEPGTERIVLPTTDTTFYFTAEAIGRVWNGEDELHTVRDDPVPYGFRRVEIPTGGSNGAFFLITRSPSIAKIHWISIRSTTFR